MKQNVVDDTADRGPLQSPAQLSQPDDGHVASTPRSDVVTPSSDERRTTSGCPVTSHSDPPRVPSSSAACVASPETGWRAVSGPGRSVSRPAGAGAAVSSPADGQPADVVWLTAASPTVGRTPLHGPAASDTASLDPLATLMRLYGTLSADNPHHHRVTSPPPDYSPATTAVITHTHTRARARLYCAWYAGRVYETLRCPFICPSVCPKASNPLLQVCCCGPGGQEIIHALLQQRRTNAGSAALSAYVGKN